MTGQQIDLESIDMASLRRVGLHIRKSFSLYKGKLLDRPIAFMSPISDTEWNPKQIAIYLNVISQQLVMPVVFAIDKLASFQRIRYIEKHIPFVIPGQQLFIPQLLVDLKSTNDKLEVKRAFFRPSTQCMLFYHLECESIEEMQQQEIADKLSYSDMTISRAMDELEDKKIDLLMDKQILWEKVKPYLSSPIRKMVYVNELDNTIPIYPSGINALAHYTDIAGEENTTYAISIDTYDKIKDSDKISYSDTYRKHTLEVWNYDPHLLTRDIHVDPLSLYVSMYDEELDERTLLALDQLIDLTL